MPTSNIKLISWNVNGLRSILTKTKDGKKSTTQIENNSLNSVIEELTPDIICLQEIRCSETFDFDEVLQYKSKGYIIVGRNCAKNKKGYSGVMVLSKLPFNDVIFDMPHLPQNHHLNEEGRVITVIYSSFILVNSYVPNSKPDLSRLEYRTKEWEPNMRKHINNMKAKYNKPIIACADWNVAPTNIDVHNPKSAKNKHGFTEEEKASFQQLLKECEMIDSYRKLHPTTIQYSWWSNFAKSRERNVGWRIDTFLVSSSVERKINDANIHTDFFGSDHAPVSLEMTL